MKMLTQLIESYTGHAPEILVDGIHLHMRLPGAAHSVRGYRGDIDAETTAKSMARVFAKKVMERSGQTYGD